MTPIDTVKAAFALPFRAIGAGTSFLIRGRLLSQTSGAQFAKPRDYRAWLKPGNSGLLLDGHSLALSETESFQNLCLIARVGAGKTSRFIIPNVLHRADKPCSVVVNDPKGEVFAATSQAMRKAGYKIIVIDPEHPDRSSRFNPLLEMRDDVELEQIADILIRCGNPSDKDGFWNKGATRFVSLFLKCLRNVAQAQGPQFLTLANVNHLFQNFGALGRPLDHFMANATINPRNPADKRLWHEWKGLLTGNPEGVQSFVLNGITALQGLSNPNIAWLTGASDFRLADLRREKTVIYFITPPQHADYYAFLTSVFFRSVFNAAMRSVPGPKDLPLYVLYDEFGHSTIPGFVATANTIRAYKVSLTIVLQSIAQLAARYGVPIADAIQGGFNTAMTLAGSDPETCLFFEKLAGKVRERQRKFLTATTDTYREYNLLNASDIRTLKPGQALVVSTNRNPVLATTRGYFEERRLRKMAAMGAVTMPVRTVHAGEMPLVRL